MHEPTEDDRRRQRADELRARIEGLRRGGADSSRPKTPREFTDQAAGEAAGRDDPAHDEENDSP
jgi:hypothetical protein